MSYIGQIILLSLVTIGLFTLNIWVFKSLFIDTDKDVGISQKEAQASLDKLLQLADEQADNEVLWENPKTVTEFLLQSQLRKLHQLIENKPPIKK